VQKKARVLYALMEVVGEPQGTFWNVDHPHPSCFVAVNKHVVDVGMACMVEPFGSTHVYVRVGAARIEIKKIWDCGAVIKEKPRPAGQAPNVLQWHSGGKNIL
jgi:hypothetical protein